jgi:hypothetical protein
MSTRKEYYHNYYLNHKNQSRQTAKKWRTNNPDKVKEIQKNWKENNPEHAKEIIKKSNHKVRLKIKLEIFNLLGSCCINPYNQHDKPYTDIRALQIDHVNGNGNKERKQFNGTLPYYKYILEKIKLGSKDYQLMCSNCNNIKRFEENEFG